VQNIISTFNILFGNYRPLSLGRINEFGIFEPIFEPQPDQERNSSSTGK
jgi:hypothetical protein